MHEYEHKPTEKLSDMVAKAYLEAYDELNGSKGYIMDAIDLYPVDRKSADRRMSMSAEELTHFDTIIEDVDKMIESSVDFDKQSVIPLWNAMKNRMIGYKAWIKTLHDEYKGL